MSVEASEWEEQIKSTFRKFFAETVKMGEARLDRGTFISVKLGANSFIHIRYPNTCYSYNK